MEVIKAARHITNKPIPTKIYPRRPGDPTHVVADSSKAQAELHWKAQDPSIEGIVKSAWIWRIKHPQGYNDSQLVVDRF